MFPSTRSNEITYQYFCTLGGLTNPAVFKMERHNGAHIYYTYHLMSVR